MASGVVKESSEIKVASKVLADMEEEEDLFEIDLDAVESTPPPHYCESYSTATTNTLLANCLLPISDVSCAIPTVSAACNYLVSTERMTNLLMVAESANVPTLPGKFGIPFSYMGNCGMERKELSDILAG